ncbi:MAG: PepSY domain-containing protein [Bacteroidota bacterium]|nr:PepSY domain-containing protein [Bacteroidota bacterium]
MRGFPVLLILLGLLVCATGCDIAEVDDEYEDEEYVTDLSKIPEAVLSAARKAVPGIVIIRVEIERTGRGTIYEVYGRANGRYYEIEIGSDGTVYEVEIEHGRSD